MTEPDRSLRVPATSAPSDEISLRDLYLVLRRRALWIVVAAVLVAVAVFFVLGARPDVYVAEATGTVSRTPVSVQGDTGLVFRPELDISFDTYTTLAYSRSVLEAVLQVVPSADLDLAQAREVLTLERLAGAGTANQPASLLAVAHRARAREPEVAAALATAWAETTIATVREVLSESLANVERITSSGLESAQAALAGAEEDLRVFREANDAGADPRGLEAARLRAATLADRRDELDRLIAAHEAELASLRARPDGQAQVVLFDAPQVTLTVDGAVWALEARIAGYEAEAERLAAQRRALADEIDELSAAVARVQTTTASLDRVVSRSATEVASLAAIEPTVAYVAQLAPTGARVLGEAGVPSAPEPRPLTLIVLLAALVTAFAGVVVALLAEAVREPAPVAHRDRVAPGASRASREPVASRDPVAPRR